MLPQLLTELCSHLKIGMPLAQDGEKTFQLALNPEFALTLKELDPGILLRAKLESCPKERREELFMHLSSANFLGQGTGGAVIALDKDENFLTLSLTLPYDMNFKAFKDKVEDFVNYVEYWKGELHKSWLDI